MNQSLKKILVPLDGSDFAEEALDAALALAAEHGGELHLVSIVSYVPSVPTPFPEEALMSDWIEGEQAKVREYLESASERASSRSPGVPVVTHVRVGRVSSTVQEVAEELDADLLVLTTHGRGAFKRSWLGSVADQLLRRVEQPLLLLRHREASRWAFDPESLSHVVVPLDGSDAAERALDALPMVLPRGGGVRVTLAYVVEESFPIPIDVPPTISGETLKEQCRLQAEAYLRRIADRLKLDGVGIVETRVIFDDDPSKGLLRFCDEAGVQLVAISTHGTGGVARFFLGSVADKLVRGAPVPVLVTKRLSEERDYGRRALGEPPSSAG